MDDWRLGQTPMKSEKSELMLQWWRRGQEQLAGMLHVRSIPMAVSHPCHPLLADSLLVPSGGSRSRPSAGTSWLEPGDRICAENRGSDSAEAGDHQCVLAPLAVPTDTPDLLFPAAMPLHTGVNYIP